MGEIVQGGSKGKESVGLEHLLHRVSFDAHTVTFVELDDDMLERESRTQINVTMS